MQENLYEIRNAQTIFKEDDFSPYIAGKVCSS